MTVIVRDLGYDRIREELEKTGQTWITAGVHSAQADRSDDVTNPLIASVHEFGTADGHIPERSFLRSTIDSRAQDISDVASKAHDRMIAGEITSEQAAEIVALWVENAIKATIRRTDPNWPPLAQSTIDAKGSSHPLIDTGQLIASVKAVVHQGEKPFSGGDL